MHEVFSCRERESVFAVLIIGLRCLRIICAGGFKLRIGTSINKKEELLQRCCCCDLPQEEEAAVDAMQSGNAMRSRRRVAATSETF